MLDGCGDEGDCPPRAYPGDGVRVCGKGGVGEEVGFEEGAVLVQGAEHEGVHEHPADQGGGGAFVHGEDALMSDGLAETVERAGEAGGGGGLEADFDGVEAEGVSEGAGGRRGGRGYGWPTASFAMPEKTPPAKPR